MIETAANPNFVCRPLPELKVSARSSRVKRMEQWEPMLTFAPVSLRAQLTRMIERTPHKELNARLENSLQYAKQLCSHAALIALLQPSLAVSYAVCLHKSRIESHDLITCTLETSDQENWSEHVSHFLMQVDADGLECAVVEALERSSMPIFKVAEQRGGNSNSSAQIVKQFLLHAVSGGNEARIRALAMKWLPHFTSSKEECLSVIDIEAYDDPLVRALAAFHCSTLNPEHPQILNALWGHLEANSFSERLSTIYVPTAELEHAENWEPHSVFRIIDDELVDATGAADSEKQSTANDVNLDRIVATKIAKAAQEKYSDQALAEATTVAANKWFSQMSLSSPSGRLIAEKALCRLYETVGKTPPRAVLWFDDPRTAAIAGSLFAIRTLPAYSFYNFETKQLSPVALYIDRLAKQIDLIPPITNECRSVWDWGRWGAGPVEEYEPELVNPCGTYAFRRIRSRGRDFWDIVETCSNSQPAKPQEVAQAWSRLRGALSGTEYAGMFDGDAVPTEGLWLHHSIQALFDRHRLKTVGYRALLSELGVCEHKDDGLDEILLNCGGFIPFSDWVIATERPIAIRRDERNRIHCTSGKAIEYGGGWGVYMLHGIRVPEQLVLAPETITCTEIEKCRNLEVRRLMIDAYGAERFLTDGKAELISEDKFGKLYYKRITDYSGHAILKVVNQTAEPDGTFKEYFLEVPSIMKTAREAVAWTFFMTEEEYDPLIET
jgi:hypothetical protein